MRRRISTLVFDVPCPVCESKEVEAVVTPPFLLDREWDIWLRCNNCGFGNGYAADKDSGYASDKARRRLREQYLEEQFRRNRLLAKDQLTVRASVNWQDFLNRNT